MKMTIWTVRACPMHLLPAVWEDGDVAQVSVPGRVPLLLQLRAELADVWTLLLFGLLTEKMMLGSRGPYRQTTGLACCSASHL